jgi:pimeloyl-ACP methyl ester carboxylesterase
LALEVSAASVALFMLVIGGYGFFSFLLMRAHTPYRAFVPTLREYLRETFLTSITQPLMPLYYVYGDRMGSGGAGRDSTPVPIVFVHGYMQNRVGFVGLARLLAQRGLGPMYALNYPWWSSISKNAKRLEDYVARVCRETKSPAVDLVCHSMGGLVAMEMMRNTAKKEHLKVRRCVTIATPHAGIAWRGPILGFEATSLRRGSKLLEAHSGYTVAVPTLSVYSSHDNIVHPKETSSLAKRGGQDFEIANMAHFSILFSPVVADEIVTFLSKPDRAPEIQEEIQELEEEIQHVPQAARV